MHDWFVSNRSISYCNVDIQGDYVVAMRNCVHNTTQAGVQIPCTVSLLTTPLQAGKRTDSFRVSWSLVRAWVLRGSHHTTPQCYVISNIRNFSNTFFVTTNMQGTNTLIYLLWIIKVSLKSFCLFVLIVCCSSHISQYTTW